jgi:shikimate kinase
LSAEIRKIKESVLQPGQNREQFAREKKEQIKELQDNRTKLAKEYLKTIAETKRQSSLAQ